MAIDQPIAPDLMSLVGAVVISVISGCISIAQRIVRGHQASPLWIISEFLSAILCGWLAYDTYPVIQDSLPDWLTQAILVATAAHCGGRTFQGIDGLLSRRYNIPLGDSRRESKEKR